MTNNINNWYNDYNRICKKEKANTIINKTAASLVIMFAIPFALTLFINIGFSMLMLIAIMIVVFIWIIFHIWFD